MKPNPAHTRTFLRAVMPPGTCLQLMAFKAQFERGNFIGPCQERFSMTLAGWYDRPDSFTVDAGRLRGVSGYLIPNPVDPAFMASSENKLRKVGKGEAADDNNITCLRWLYIDFDPVKPGREMSATDAELAATVSKRDRFLSDFQEIQEHAMWGCSGNGSWILVRLPDYPNDREHGDLIRRAVDFASKEYGADPATKNPARLMPLIGTFKCKGSSRPERPWRLATLDSPPTESTGFDLTSWVARRISVSSPQGGAVAFPAINGNPDRFAKYARGALEKEIRAVESAQPGGRNNALNRAAVALAEIVAVGHLQQSEVEQCLTLAARGIGLGEIEIERTIQSGIEYGLRQPRDLATATVAVAPPACPPVPPPAGGQEGDDAPCIPGYEDNPHRLAREFVQRKFAREDGVTLRFWHEDFHVWMCGSYRVYKKSEIRAMISEFLKEEFERVYHQQLQEFGRAANRGGDDKVKVPRPIPVTTNIVGHVLQAVAGLTLVESAKHPDQPCWLDQEGPWPVTECVPMQNGIIHLPSFAAGQECTREPTPRLFSPYVLGYDFDPDAPTPDRWLSFLKELWPEDPESIDTLQEWMGLQLVPDTRYQKIMALIGPKRCGKGTIANVMARMVGHENCVAPTSKTFEDTFGLQDFVGKLCAVFDDFRLSSRADQATIAERFLTISAGGQLTVRRMHRPGWTGRLSTRITLMSNELPRFSDTSDALVDRFIVLRFTRSFYGMEDVELEAKLAEEMPGIFLWAVEGLRRLRERRRLIQPATGVEECNTMRDIASNHGAFVRECGIVDPDEWVTCEEAYRAWCAWCERNNKRETGTQALLGRDLRSVVPSLTTKQRWINKVKLRVYEGFGLKAPHATGGLREGEGDMEEWAGQF